MNVNHGETAPGVRRLFIAQSWPYVQKALSLLHQLDDSDGQDFLITTNPDLKSNNSADKETILVLGALGHSVVTQDEARNGTYDEVHLVPSSVLYPGTDSLPGTLDFSRLVAHGDTFKNTVFVSPKIAESVTQILKYGLNLEEASLKHSKISREAQSDPIVVSSLSVRKTWEVYAKCLNWTPHPLSVSDRDLLVCERYWGSRWYRMKPRADLTGYLSQVLQLSKTNYGRIIFRGPLVRDAGSSAWESATIELAKLNNLEYTTWDDLVAGSDMPTALNHPEAQFFLGGLEELGGLFAFDSTLCLIFGRWSERTKVHWADGADTSEIFEHSRICDVVAEQSRWMRLASAKSLESGRATSGPPAKVTTDGTGYLMIYAENVISDLQSQLEVRDTSFSWQVTKPLRAIGKLLPR